MNLIERVVAEAGADTVRRIEVPEWGTDGKPLIITYTMVSLADLATVHDLDQGSDFNKNAARIVAMKACDEAGARLFKMGDAITLREKASPNVVKSIALKMLSRTSIEDAEKN